MFPLNREQIKNLKEEDLETLCYLDSQGLLPGTGESFTEYKIRILKICDDIDYIKSEINTKKSICIDHKTRIKADELLSEEKYIKPNVELTQKYDIKIDWVSSFFHRNIGLLAGACTLTLESGLSVILISKKFKYKNKWFIYYLDELITHELCHSARTPIKDNELEEFFAYSLSSSPIRRYFGNCFRRPVDSLLLLFPILLLMCIQIYKAYFFYKLNTVFFWALVFLYPLFLIIRNQMSIRVYQKAKNYLEKTGLSPKNVAAILFRCNYTEIKEIAGFYKNSDKAEKWFYKKINIELRWKVISARFFTQIKTFDHVKI